MQKTLTWNDSLAKQKSLYYTTGKCRPKESSLNFGDQVLVKHTHQNKLSLMFKLYPYRIIGQESTMLTAKQMSTNHRITCNQTHFKSIPETAIVPKQEQVEHELVEDLDLEVVGEVVECENETLRHNRPKMTTHNEKRIQNETDVPYMNGANTNRHLFLCYILDKNCFCFFCCFRGKM